MERIQSAIAKARAARETGQPEAAPGAKARAAAPATTPVETGPVAASWAALQPFSPDLRQLEQQRVYPRSGGPLASAFDVLRTRVLQQMQANNWRRLAITSPTTGCGKSTVALNLAFSLARQPERRVLLAELDMRRPSLGRILGIRDEADFAAVLAGRAEFSESARRYGENFAVACNGGPGQAPSELLQSSSVPQILAQIENEYAPDIMLFDEPPLMAGDDVMAFTTHVDAVLIVAAAEETTIKQLDQCERELAQQTNIIGVVLNKCRYDDDVHDYSSHILQVSR